MAHCDEHGVLAVTDSLAIRIYGRKVGRMNWWMLDGRPPVVVDFIFSDLP